MLNHFSPGRRGGTPVTSRCYRGRGDRLAESGAFVSKTATLKPDIAVVSDTNQFGPGIPRSRTPAGVHGSDAYGAVASAQRPFGGTVANPGTTVQENFWSLHDDDGRGDDRRPCRGDVVPLTRRGRNGRLPYDEKAYAKELNVPKSSAKGFPLERRWAAHATSTA